MDAFALIATVAAVIAGAIASISGFGIGSVLTPVLSTQFDVRLAIAMVSLPHLAGTFVRFLLVRKRIDRDVLLGFGAASAIGGLVGAALQAVVQSSALAIIFGGLLVFAGIGSLTGFAQRMRFSGRRSALVGGALSGLLGGSSAIRAAYAPRRFSASTSRGRPSSPRPRLSRSSWTARAYPSISVPREPSSRRGGR